MQEGVCLNMQAQKQGLCILYRKLLLFAASRIHNVLSTGDQDVGLYKHQAVIPYITGPGGELCVMRRNSFAREGKTQKARIHGRKQEASGKNTPQLSLQIITRQTTPRKTYRDMAADSQSIHCLLKRMHL